MYFVIEHNSKLLGVEVSDTYAQMCKKKLQNLIAQGTNF